MNKTLLVLVLSIVASVAIAAFAYQRFSLPQVVTTHPPLKVARYYWPGEFWIDIADQQGFFAQEGLAVELIDTNADYQQSLSDTVIGRIDVNSFSLFDIMNYRLKGADLQAVLAADSPSGSEGIAIQPEYENLSQLRGQRIAVAKGTYLEYVLDHALDEAGVNPDDVIKVDLPGEAVAEPFAQKQVAAAVTWEPLLSELVELGGRRAYDTAQSPGLLYFVFAFNQDFIDERPADVEKFVRVWHRTTTFIEENPESAQQIIADIYEVPPAEVAAFMEQDTILNLKDNVVLFEPTPDLTSLHGSAQPIIAFIQKKGLTQDNAELDPETFLMSDFIDQLARQEL